MKIPEEVIRRVAKLAGIPGDPYVGEGRTVMQVQEELLSASKKLSEHYTSNEAKITPRSIANLSITIELLELVGDDLQRPVIPLPPIQPGEQPPSTPRTFAAEVASLIYLTHRAVAARNKQPVAKKVEHHAGELIKHLKAFNDLPALSENDEILWKIAALRGRAAFVGRTKVRHQLGWVRRDFVEGLRWAAKEAGGRLTLNRRKEGGTLVDAIVSLRPYLPEELRAGMSFATLRRMVRSPRRICVAQTSKKALKKTLI